MPSAKEAFVSKSSAAFERVQSFEEDIADHVTDAKADAVDKLVDLEDEAERHVDGLGEGVQQIKKTLEEVLRISSEEHHDAEEEKKEE